MLTIQQVGTEILGKNPRKFYVFLGSEYGVKRKYINMLSELYGEHKEAHSVKELLSFMSTKHLIRPNPACYVVRYDDEFVSTLNSDTEKQITRTNIIGTIVCIYDGAKYSEKLCKYLPEFSVSIDKINMQFIVKYLHQDFPRLPDRLISSAAEMATDYNHAYNICSCMTHASVEDLYKLSDDELRRVFGVSDLSSEKMIKLGVASRNFKYLVSVLDSYPESIDSLFYTILSTIIELEKLSCNNRIQSDLQDYIRRWTKRDIYNMFMNTYQELVKLRTISSDSYSSLIYLFSLLQFSEIPYIGEI